MREDGALDEDEQKEKMQLKIQACNMCARPRPLSVRKVEQSPKREHARVLSPRARW